MSYLPGALKLDKKALQLLPLLLLFKSECFCQEVAPSSPSSDQDANYRDSEEEGHVITTCPQQALAVSGSRSHMPCGGP